MSDFLQSGTISTLHRLGEPNLARLEEDLLIFSREKPIALVLPCHADELGTPALARIVATVSSAPYLTEVVVGLDGADENAFRHAQNVFTPLGNRLILLWNDGPEMQAILGALAEAELDAGPSGKGRNLWLCAGCVLASGRSRVIAAHDCDITTYDRELLARLCYPVAHPNLGFDFCKGYSARFTDRLNGRVMRLLLSPVVRSLRTLVGDHDFLRFLEMFRYPLSGEVSFDIEVIRRARVPHDWGVDIGLLAEVFRVCSPKAVCQIDIAECYDHKHQDLSRGDPTRGLNKMAADIAQCLFRTLAGLGVRLDRGLFDTLPTTYVQLAEDAMRSYAADADINGLLYDRHDEETAVHTFAASIRSAALRHLENPLADPMIPDWNRVETTCPRVLRALSNIAG